MKARITAVMKNSEVEYIFYVTSEHQTENMNYQQRLERLTEVFQEVQEKLKSDSWIIKRIEEIPPVSEIIEGTVKKEKIPEGVT